MNGRAAVAGALLLGACLAPHIAAQGLPTGTPAALGLSAARLARIDSVFQRFVDSGRIAGGVALIVRHGKVGYVRSFGWADREAKRPMTATTLFRIASQTKAITSVAAMILVEEGKLRLDDPVSRFIPSFAHDSVAPAGDSGALVPAHRGPVIRDLLTHTSGLSYGVERRVAARYRAAGLGPAAGYGWYFADKDEPICSTIDRLGALPLVAQPGADWVYGYSLDVLGCVIERVSGIPLDRFIHDRILVPLRMRDTWFFPPDSVAGRLAVVYAPSDSGLVRAGPGGKGQGDYLRGPRKSFSGGAGLVSTIGDYARFLQMMLNGGELDGARILSPATVRLMTSNQVDTLFSTSGSGFGLGFEILLDPGRAGEYGSPGRFGWGGAYGTNYWVDPGEDMVALEMIQLLPPNIDLSDRFRATVYQAIVGAGAAGR